MKNAIKINWLSLSVLMAAVLVIGCGEGAFLTEKATTVGIVAVKDQDASGKVKSVEIKVDDRPGIIVKNSGKGKELIGAIGKKVEVNGMLWERAGVKNIKVESYKLIG